MPNTCRVIITRGKNKGQACGDVNKKCRHKNIECPHCGIRFTVETSYMRHRANCGSVDMDIKTSPSPSPSPPRIKLKVKIAEFEPAPTIAAPTIAAPTIAAPTIADPVAHKLLRKIERLERELEVVKNKPAVHHHWNIVLGMNFFEELVGKMGRADAINFLTDIATEGKPVDVITKLYLEGNSPTSYPIACQDHDHFRYIDAEHRLIDDKGGHGISQIVSSGVHEALILAANEAIQDHVQTENYENFNIAPIQKYVADMRRSLPQDRIISELAHMTSIPNHPFFKDSDSFNIKSTLADI
jgi:hypothetical protein